MLQAILLQLWKREMITYSSLLTLLINYVRVEGGKKDL